MHTLKITIILAILVALILSIGLFTHNILSSTADRLGKHIAQIENNTIQGNWTKAEEQLSAAKNEWSGTGDQWAMLIDHIEIDNIDTSLSKMEKYIFSKNAPLALAEAATLKQYIEHIPEKESFRLKNIF
ncbi:MAG: DUF4363 family protein [Clostridia bacterium]|nr:DUF4363 family protein [Clostridia bacterium]